MSGRLLLNPTAGYTHLRVRFSLAQGGALDFYDPRAFGRLWYIRPEESAQLIIPTLVRLGPEPEDLSAQHLITVFARRQIPIKTALLDQTCLAGLGNIYADESLFLAAIHPTTPANTLNLSQVTRLVAAIQQVLAKAIGLGGTTFRDYADSRGQIGRYQDVLNVYGRFQQLCKQCGTPIERLRLGGRSSHFCPLCQVYDRLSGNPMTTAP
jgi:formamidopyrimidine-DNA glycosylase